MNVLASLQAEELRLLHRIMCDLAGPVADTITAYAEDPLFGVPVFLLLLLLPLSTARGRSLLPRTLIALVIAMGIATAVKAACWTLVPRTRPGSLFPKERPVSKDGVPLPPEPVLRGSVERATCAEHPTYWIDRKHAPEAPSFPSSHVIYVTSAAVVLTAASRGVGLLAWLYAAAVAFARLYGGKHWPSDVLGSILLAVAGGLVGWRLARRAVERLRARRTARGTVPAGDVRTPGPPDEAAPRG